MFRNIAAISTVALLLLISTLTGTNSPVPSTTIQKMGQMPLAFTKNMGQWDERVLFRANSGGATMWFTKEGVTYQFFKRIKKESTNTEADVISLPDKFASERDSIESMVISAKFVGANPNPEAVGEGEMEYKCNYFLGNDPAKWHVDVPNYQAMMYKEICRGISLSYYSVGHQIEYDLVASPLADLSLINIRYSGCRSLRVNDEGDLVIETPWGSIVEKSPIVYQIDGFKRRSVSCYFQVVDSNSFGFKLGSDYNPLLSVVIDPVLVYSTYLGGSNDDFGHAIAVDNLGNAYIAGTTFSSDFPSVNPYDGIFNGGDRDVFVAKLSPGGNSLVYCTYLGGSNYWPDEGSGIAVDISGNVYVTGTTYSSDFPIFNPYDASLNGLNSSDVFVTGLGPAGNVLIYSTFLGGRSNESGFGVAVDEFGNAYVTGNTSSTDFPITAAFDTSMGGTIDAFVTKLSSGGSSLIYSSFLGGSSSEFGYGISVDETGSAYITGKTSSVDFMTANPINSNFNGGPSDVFVTKVNPLGNNLIYSTYLGGTLDDIGYGVALDQAQCAYVTGLTTSPNFTTFMSYDSSLTGSQDAFVTKLSPAGSSLVFSSFLGGNSWEKGSGIGVDSAGNAYVTGWTMSSNFPCVGAFDSTWNGNICGFLTRFNRVGNKLDFSSYLGGSTNGNTEAIAIDKIGSTFVTGNTSSLDFPIVTPLDSMLNGGYDAFVTRLSALICGDADGNGFVNISDAVFLISYIFSGGPAPSPLLSGDSNCDATVNISDAVYLIAYIFAGGAAPCAACK